MLCSHRTVVQHQQGLAVLLARKRMLANLRSPALISTPAAVGTRKTPTGYLGQGKL